jgi:hypothetical protein
MSAASNPNVPAPVSGAEENERVRDQALGLARQLAEPIESFDPIDGAEVFAQLLEEHDDPRAVRLLDTIEQQELAVPKDKHERGGPGSTIRALNAARGALGLAVSLGEEVAREIDTVRGNSMLSDAGKQQAIEAVLVRHRERLAKETGAKFTVAMENIAERAEFLQKSIRAAKPEKPNDLERVAQRLEVLAILQIHGGQGGAEALAVDLARRGDPRAAVALEIAALASVDPLRLRRLVSKVSGFSDTRRVTALLSDEKRGLVAAELHHLERVRSRILNARQMLASNPQEAKLIASNLLK